MVNQFHNAFEAEKVKITTEGGIAIKLTNNSGATIIAGRIVRADAGNNDSIILTAAGELECIGVVYEDVTNGSTGWVIIAGIADVLMGDNEAATRGNWVETNNAEAGYADSTGAAPNPVRHFNEIGHCVETVAAGGGGTHIKARCVIHFN